MIVILALLSSIALQPYYYTNTNYYYDLAYRNGVLYAATNGGLLAKALPDRSYDVLTNTDGLQTNRQICCSIDSSGYVWSGNENGLALVDPTFSQVFLYPDQVINSFVQHIVCLPDSIYVGSPGGLLFIETHGTPANFDDDSRTRLYIQNGLLSNNVQAIAVTGNQIWAGTDQGITRFVKSFHPDSFQQYTTTHGLLSNDIYSIEVVQGSVYVATDQGLNVFNGATFDTLLANIQIVDISYLGDSIVLALDTLLQIGIYYQGSFILAADSLPYRCRVMDVENVDGELYCGLGSRWSEDRYGLGYGVFDPVVSTWTVIKRECLPSNHISEIDANVYGIFCALGARRSHSQGIGWLHDDGHWDGFTRDSILPSNNIHRCSLAPDGRMWFGINAFSCSGADTIMLISYDVGQDEWHFIPRGYLNIDTTCAVWDIEFDKRNYLYMALSGPSDKLWVIDSSLQTATFLGDWRQGFNVEIAIDSSDIIWRTVFGSDGGLLMIDTRGTIFDRNDDYIHEFGVSDGMISKYAYGCIVDGNNTLYVANDTGLLVYDGDEFQGYTGITSQEIFDVELDTEGRIWLMSRTGLYYFDPQIDLIQGWEYYQLGVDIEFLEFSNEVIQIQAFEFDPLRQCFWLGGETGLLQISIVQDSFVTFDSVLIYPNPAVAVPTVRIKNLPLDSRVNIYSITGRSLARDLIPDVVFNEVVWNIPDDAASGLYFAVVITEAGKKVCKFAIVR